MKNSQRIITSSIRTEESSVTVRDQSIPDESIHMESRNFELKEPKSFRQNPFYSYRSEQEPLDDKPYSGYFEEEEKKE